MTGRCLHQLMLAHRGCTCFLPVHFQLWAPRTGNCAKWGASWGGAPVCCACCCLGSLHSSDLMWSFSVSTGAMTQQPQEDFDRSVEDAQAWMKVVQGQLQVNDNTQGPRAALEARLRETEVGRGQALLALWHRPSPSSCG